MSDAYKDYLGSIACKLGSAQAQVAVCSGSAGDRCVQRFGKGRIRLDFRSLNV